MVSSYDSVRPHCFLSKTSQQFTFQCFPNFHQQYQVVTSHISLIKDFSQHSGLSPLISNANSLISIKCILFEPCHIGSLIVVFLNVQGEIFRFGVFVQFLKLRFVEAIREIKSVSIVVEILCDISAFLRTMNPLGPTLSLAV